MPEERQLRLAVIDVKPGAAMESQSGLQMLRPRIYGAYEAASRPIGAGAGRRTGAIVMHPASNFMGHYLIAPLAERGVTCLGLNSRYAGNDTVPLMGVRPRTSAPRSVKYTDVPRSYPSSSSALPSFT